MRKVSPIRQVANDIIFGSLSKTETETLRRIVGIMVGDLRLAIHELNSPSWAQSPSHSTEFHDQERRLKRARSKQREQ